MGNASSGTPPGSEFVPYGKEKPEMGRRPNDSELLILHSLQRDLFTKLRVSEKHAELLNLYEEATWAAIRERDSNNCMNSGKEGRECFPLEQIGYQGDIKENRMEEFVSGGVLGIKALIYFVSRYPIETHLILRRRYSMKGYPFIKTAMAILRVLCECFLIIDGCGKRGKFSITPTLYWQVLSDEESFYLLFSFCLLCLDESYIQDIELSELPNDISTDITPKSSAFCPLSTITLLAEKAKKDLLSELNQAPRSLDHLERLSAHNGDNFFKKSLEQPRWHTAPHSQLFSKEKYDKYQRRATYSSTCANETTCNASSSQTCNRKQFSRPALRSCSLPHSFDYSVVKKHENTTTTHLKDQNTTLSKDEALDLFEGLNVIATK